MRLFTPMILASALLPACSKQEFGGSAGRTDAEQAACDKDIETLAELITPEVKNGDPNNQLEYNLSVVNCDKEKVGLQSSHIQFDIDGVTDRAGDGEPYPYIVTSGDLKIEGEIEEVQGSDLFGNTGENYYHNRTDKSLTLPEGTLVIKLTIKLEGSSFKPREGEASADNLLPTFLQFGEAKTVRKDVHFLGLFPESDD